MNDVPMLNGQNRDEGNNWTHPKFNDNNLAAVEPLECRLF